MIMKIISWRIKVVMIKERSICFLIGQFLKLQLKIF